MAMAEIVYCVCRSASDYYNRIESNSSSSSKVIVFGNAIPPVPETRDNKWMNRSRACGRYEIKC